LPLDLLARDAQWATQRAPISLLALGISLVRVGGADDSRKGATKEVQAKMPHKSWFALFTFAFIVKCLCMLSNLLGQVSPIPQVLRFNKAGDTGDADAAPFMSMLYGGFQWSFYGFLAFIVTGRSGFLVLVYSNIFGATLGVLYVSQFHRNCRNKESLHRLYIYYKIAAFLFTMQLLAIASGDPKRTFLLRNVVIHLWYRWRMCSTFYNAHGAADTVFIFNQCSVGVLRSGFIESVATLWHHAA